MKKLVFVGLLAMLATACAKNDLISKSNPASEYCESIGGTVQIVTDPKGAYGLCHLPSGEVVDEWVLFNSNNK